MLRLRAATCAVFFTALNVGAAAFAQSPAAQLSRAQSSRAQLSGESLAAPSAVKQPKKKAHSRNDQPTAQRGAANKPRAAVALSAAKSKSKSKSKNNGDDDNGKKNGDKDDDDNGTETENLFGFTSGSDTNEAGEKQIELETESRFGKRSGRYAAIAKKLEFSYGFTDNFEASLGLLANYHRIANVPGLADTRSWGFNGVGGEVRWRLVKRGPSPVGVTLQFEPGVATHEELSGQPARRYGSENKLIIDTELVKERVFAAFNLIYDFERSRERGETVWENESVLGVSLALAGQVLPKTFVGAELRYLRAYEGLGLQTFEGEALYVGPTLLWKFAHNAWLSAAWNVQIAGREAGSQASLDLSHFDRHQVKFKLGVDFEPAQKARPER